MADHGTRKAYIGGCRCVECKSANSTYVRELKARKAGADVEAPRRGRPPKFSVVSDFPQDRVSAPASDLSAHGDTTESGGPATQAVLAELESLTSAGTRLGAAQAALAMARLLDNPGALAQHKGAADSLVRILDDLRQGSARRKGRLASVQAMSKAATGGEKTG